MPFSEKLKEMREKVTDVQLFGPKVWVAQAKGPALLGPTARDLEAALRG